MAHDSFSTTQPCNRACKRSLKAGYLLIFLSLLFMNRVFADTLPEPWSNWFRLYIRVQHNSRLINIESKSYHLVLQDSLGLNDTIRLFEDSYKIAVVPGWRGFNMPPLRAHRTRCQLLDGQDRKVYDFEITASHPVFQHNRILLLDILLCNTHYLKKVKSSHLRSFNIQFRKACFARKFAIGCITNGQCCERSDSYQYSTEEVSLSPHKNILYHWLRAHYPRWSAVRKARWDAKINRRMSRLYDKYYWY